MTHGAFHIRAYQDADQQDVVALISGIQQGEFGLQVSPQDQPDLLDIPGFYTSGQHGPGGFWVAKDGERLLGCIALLNIGHGQGALRKMFVDPSARGTGLAAALLCTLEAGCPKAGIRVLYLGTTTRFLAAHRFYAKHGFLRVDKNSLPAAFPVMAVDTVFYAKRLPAA